jgi:thiol-disulfide isomerase/thioredoxin
MSLRPHRLHLLVPVALVALAGACRSRERKNESSPPAATAAKPSTARPYFVKAPERLETAQPFLKEQLASAQATGERVLVYVGASWCEPCERFHEAVEAGELDALLAGTRFVEFDADRHTEALGEAGYVFQMIPVIAEPTAAGAASGRQLTGSIKGPAAVHENLVPRLKALLEGRPVD